MEVGGKIDFHVFFPKKELTSVHYNTYITFCPFFLGLENTCKEFVEKFKFEVCCA
jgi:hypothetical protein